MPTAYHFDKCQPANLVDGKWRTIFSKFDSTCAGCQKVIREGDKIAFVPDGQSSSSSKGLPPGQDSQQVKTLTVGLAELKQELYHLKQEFNLLRRNPIDLQPPAMSGTEAAAVLDGRLVEAEADTPAY